MKLTGKKIYTFALVLLIVVLSTVLYLGSTKESKEVFEGTFVENEVDGNCL